MTAPKFSILQRLREWLSLILMALLPFHAFLITVLTKLITGPGHAPMSSLAAWKEGLLVLIVGVACVEIVSRHRERLRQTDLLDWLVVALIVLSVAVSMFTHTGFSRFALGFKYDFLPLAAFVVLRRTEWSPVFFRRLPWVLLGVAGLVAAYGIVSFVLPERFFLSLGYSNAYSLYFPDAPLTSFQQIPPSMIRRIQATLSGPNQLGTWLLLPWGVLLCSAFGLQRDRLSAAAKRGLIALSIVLVLALLLSFSRAAWAGAVIMLLAALWTWAEHCYQVRVFSSSTIRIRVLAGAGVVLLIVLAAVWLFAGSFIRLGSTRAHFDRPIEAAHRMIAQPLGEGLGSVGPASNRFSDACVFLRKYDNASWARHFPNLCVYTGGHQVQPIGKTCTCAFLPENWYLQIGVETGIAGFFLYLALTGALLHSLLRRARAAASSPLAQAAFLTLLGGSVVALFLHAWEDAAITYSLWLLIAAVLPAMPPLKRPPVSS